MLRTIRLVQAISSCRKLSTSTVILARGAPRGIGPGSRTTAAAAADRSAMVRSRRDQQLQPDKQPSREIKSFRELCEVLPAAMTSQDNQELAKAFSAAFNVALVEPAEEFKNSQEFRQMCEITLHRIRFFDKQQAMNVLACLVALRVDPRVTLITATLQVIRQHLNDLEVKQILFMDRMLEIIEQRIEISDRDEARVMPLIKVLKDAIPLLLEVKLNNREYAESERSLIKGYLRKYRPKDDDGDVEETKESDHYY